MSGYPCILNNNQITVVIDGDTKSINSDSPNFKLVKDAIREQRWEDVRTYIDMRSAVETVSHGRVTVRDGQVYYDDQPVNNYVGRKIVQLLEDGFDISPLANFMEDVMQNPSNSSVEELYMFLEANDMPLMEDGRFIAYKAVRDDYTDMYSGKFSNAPGQVCRMERNQVDDRRYVTCSHGLHAAALPYAKMFGGQASRIVLLAIWPRHVVSVPNDYNNQKMRVSEYEVLSESDEEFTTSVYVPTFSDGYGDDVDLDEEPYEGEDILDQEYGVELSGLTYDGEYVTTSYDCIQADDEAQAENIALDMVSQADFSEDVDMSTVRVRMVW
jgi:hypothetical protein